MKFIKFAEANRVVKTAFDGDDLHFFSDDNGSTIVCAEIDKDDLKVIRDNGRVYILIAGFNAPPPIGVQAQNPFKNYENKDSKSASDDKQSDQGDYKLSIS